MLNGGAERTLIFGERPDPKRRHDAAVDVHLMPHIVARSAPVLAKLYGLEGVPVDVGFTWPYDVVSEQAESAIDARVAVEDQLILPVDAAVGY